MPFDGIVTRCVAQELNDLLAGGRVEKVFQPERDEVHLLVRSRQRETYRLLLGANAAAPRVHITESGKENPQNAPMFCMILRKYLAGGRVTRIVAEGFERVVSVFVESASEMGDVSEKELVVEVMGKYSNIILLDEKRRILDSLVHVDSDINRVREIMPARDYAPPPAQDKLQPAPGAEGAVLARLASLADAQPMQKLDQALTSIAMGFSPVMSQRVCEAAGLPPKTPLALVLAPERRRLGEALGLAVRRIDRREYQPCVLLGGTPEKPIDFHCFANLAEGTVAPVARMYGTMSGAIDAYYTQRGLDASLAQRKSALAKTVNTHLSRAKKKLALREESLRSARDRDRFKLMGELLLANLQAVPPGAASARLQNYYDPAAGEVDVPLEPGLNAQANAQLYFKKYRRAASTQKYAEAQIAESRMEIDYLESVLEELERAEAPSEIDEIRQELAQQKYAPSAAKGGASSAKGGAAARRGGPKAQPSAPRMVVSADGLRIYIGRNNRQNDLLTMKTASSNDLWFHARNIPGAHVLVKKEQGEVPEATVAQAAALAAFFSKARAGGKAEVDYTQARNVKKPPGARPGMVTYSRFKTIAASADEGARLAEAVGKAEGKAGGNVVGKTGGKGGASGR